MNLNTLVRILLEQLRRVALGGDLARQLVRQAQALVVGAQLVHVVGDAIERQEPLSTAAICVPIWRA